MKATRNKIFAFPKKLREDIDKLILEGQGISVVRDYIKNNAKDQKVSVPTIRAYRDMILKGTSQIVATDQDIIGMERELADIQKEQEMLESSYISDKSAYIDALSFKVSKKLAMFERLDMTHHNLDLKKERVYQTYINIARELVETKAKLSGEISSDNNLVVTIVQNRMDGFNKLVLETLKEVCPDKIIQFQDVFKKKFGEMKDDILNFAKKVN